jgi:cytochrome oxidase Cu insertion factor (SCO1/SenC/PrrC family)
MKRRSWIIVTSFAFVASACGRNAATPSSAREGPIPVWEAAPAFTLESAEGKRVSLSDHAGKPVLLNFSMGPG